MASNSTQTAKLQKALAPYLTSSHIVSVPLSTLSLMFFIYGVYTIIFALSIHVLLNRKSTSSTPRLYLWCTITLFVLETLNVIAITWTYGYKTNLEFGVVKTGDLTPLVKYFSYSGWEQAVPIIIADNTIVFMNAIADAMLIHRCYIVWQSNKTILFSLTSVAFILNAINFSTYIIHSWFFTGSHASAYKTEIYRNASTVNNACNMAIAVFSVLLALLTGGRIWWMSSQARKVFGKETQSRYRSIVLIIIESGFLYASTLFITSMLLTVVDPDSSGVLPFDPSVISMPMAGLAPTVIIVRAAYGAPVPKSVQDVATIAFAENSNMSRDLEGGNAAPRERGSR